MTEKGASPASLPLEDGANIAVIGGGPTGSFFSIFALKMAQMVGKELNVTVFEPKDFTKDGPLGCNRCGGIVSELLVQTLAVEGINLPETVIQRGINSYKLHTIEGSVSIATPSLEKTIASVYRGGGPKGVIGKEKESFDDFLLGQAREAGARHESLKIDRVAYKGGRTAIFSQDREVMEADLVVGAVGVKSATNKIFEDMGFGYRAPEIAGTAIAEIALDKVTIAEIFGNAIQLFLLPIKGIKFAAMIPKGTYVTVCILGKNISANTVSDFLGHPVVKKVLPDALSYSIQCRCLPKMNVRAPEKAFADRVVMCGDAGSTRLFKDGLNAAYIMGKAAAKTAVFQGVGREDFETNYHPVYKSLIVDNNYGRFLYAVSDLYREHTVLRKGMLEIVRREQASPASPKVLSSVLWDMFTGNERYRNIFPRAVSLMVNRDFWGGSAKALLRR